tara:strand:- start:483 stop:860 length:378 start_codon:yes stop_codon:yes gene_type:complete
MSENENINKVKKRRRSKGKIYSENIKLKNGKPQIPISILRYENDNVQGYFEINSRNPQNEKRFKKLLENDILSQFENLKIFYEKSNDNTKKNSFPYDWVRCENGDVKSYRRKNTKKKKNKVYYIE